MKIYFVIFTTFIVGFLGCKNNKNQQHELRRKLIGKWGGPHEKPMWDIRNDTFYFIEPALSCHYKLFGDTLIVDYPDSIKNLNFGKIRINGDTLFMYDYNNSSTRIAYKYKK